MTKHQAVFLSTLLLFVLSCSNENKDISTHVVLRKNFESSIVIDAYAEPMQSLTISCPSMNGDGTVAFIIKDGTWVKEGDILCSIENQSLQTYHDQLQVDLENAKAGIEKTKADLNMQYTLLEAEVKTNDAETQIAQLDSSRLQYYSPNQRKTREMELKIVAINRQRIASKLTALGIIQHSEIRKLELEIRRYTNNLESVKNDLKGLVLKAPKKGLAIRANNPMTGKKIEVGDVVWDGIPLVNLPEMEKMKMKILASERDYKYISVNDSVSYSFDALDGNIAWGKILNKMPIGQPIKDGSQIKYFEIEASVDSTQTMPDPGFTATCNVVLKQVKDTIVIPQIAIFDQDSMKVVYVQNKKGYEMRQILLGESSPKEAIVKDGLYLNEKIALSRPKESEIKNRKVLSDSINTIKH